MESGDAWVHAFLHSRCDRVEKRRFRNPLGPGRCRSALGPDSESKKREQRSPWTCKAPGRMVPTQKKGPGRRRRRLVQVVGSETHGPRLCWNALGPMRTRPHGLKKCLKGTDSVGTQPHESCPWFGFGWRKISLIARVEPTSVDDISDVHFVNSWNGFPWVHESL